MIEYIKGEIFELLPTKVVLETAGIGYDIQISVNTYTQLNGQKSARLFIYESIREDAHILYGFLSSEERQVFILLISVNGVGANTARMILSSYSASEVQSMISTANERAISAVKGIGLKTAQKIIVDLKDKIIKLQLSPDKEPSLGKLVNNEAREEALSALSMLGFASTPSQKAVDQILSKEPELSVEKLIKLALKML